MRQRSIGPTVFRGKFCQIKPTILQNSVAHRVKIVQILRFTVKVALRLWVNWPISCPKNFSYWRLPLCSVMLRTFN